MEARKDREIAELTEQVKRLQAIASASEADANAVSLGPGGMAVMRGVSSFVVLAHKPR
jgi:hypothetical protein